MASNNPPAFPVPSDFIPNPAGGFINTREYGTQPLPGMDLRDYFAAQAMVEFIRIYHEMHMAGHWQAPPSKSAIANDAYLQADAMLVRREIP